MSAESWKTLFDIAAIILLFLTFAAGTGAFIFGNIVNKRQAAQLRQFDRDLTGAKIALGRQQERAAEADERASKIEAGNIQLRTDLQNATSESRSAQVRLEQEEQKTAKAQKEASEAQLALNKVLIKRALGRFANPRDFEALKNLPKATATILYKEGDGEAYMYASEIVQCLRGIGWTVPPNMPTPIRQPFVADGASHAPVLGNKVIAKTQPTPEEIMLPNTTNRVGLLMRALGAAGLLVDPSLPDDTFVIVIGERME